MKQQTVGMIGLGIMGSAMSANLTRAGFRVAGFDVVPRRRAEHKRTGGIAAKSPRDVAKRADLIITSLPSAHALAEVAAGLAASAKRGTIVIETSTLPIPVKEAARAALATRGMTHTLPAMSRWVRRADSSSSCATAISCGSPSSPCSSVSRSRFPPATRWPG